MWGGGGMELGKRSSFKFTFLLFKDERRNAHFSKFNNERERGGGKEGGIKEKGVTGRARGER